MSGRIRTVKPEWLEDELLASASDEARVLSIALILMADDYGRGRASIASIAAGAWRYQMERDGGEHAPEVLARASRALRELVEIGFVTLYDVSRQRYFEIRNWSKHQKVDRPSKPRIPAPSDAESLDNQDAHETLASEPRDTRETLATDLRPPTSDLRPPTGERGASRATPSTPSTPRHVEAFERSFAQPHNRTEDVERLISETRIAAGGVAYRARTHTDRYAVQRLAEWASAPEIGLDRLRAALEAFWAGKGTGARLSWLTEEDPGRFLGQPVGKRSRIAPAGTRAEHEAAVAAAGGVGSAIIEI